ncbi:MAG TPA: hypothetical protein DEP19_04800 [Anaerolineae bacterium]|nr:hypothetical protein [Anaerolineae bacterium]
MSTPIQMNPLHNPPLSGEYYEINPETVLSEIEEGNIEVFQYFEERDIYPEHPSGSFAWSSADYFAIAKAHHLYRTGETADGEWKIFAPGSFEIDQCSDDMQGFDKATIIFYKREPESFPVVYIEIRPLREHIYSAIPDYERISYDTLIENFLFDPDTAFKEALSVQGSITAEKALQIAEEAGGKELRQQLSNNECRIVIAYFFDKWVVRYYWGGTYFLTVDIDPNDGTYKIER